MTRRRALLAGVAVGAVVLAAWAVAANVAESDPVVAGVRLAPPSVQGCLPAEVTVTLDRPAAGAAAVVALAASSAVAEVPARLHVPAGATEASAAVTTRAVAVTERVAVRAVVVDPDAPGQPSLTRAATAALEVTPVQAATVSTGADAACVAGFTDLHGYADPVRVGAFDAAVIPEASGLAASRRNPGWLYVVDDERPRAVYAMRTDGSGLRAIPIEGFEGRDTEALAVGPCGPAGPETCVYVGDIGDNLGVHRDVAILRFAEPDLSAPPAPVAPDAIAVTYPDGPANAEALLVDDAGVLYTVTKDAGPDGLGAARLYATDGFASGVLTDLGPIEMPGTDRSVIASALGVLVTGGDYRDGRVALRTYDAVVEYVAPAPGAPLARFPSWPARVVPAAGELQSEAVAYAADGCGYVTVSERVGDIWFVGCRR